MRSDGGMGKSLLNRFVTCTVVQNIVRAIKRRRIVWVEHVASVKALRRISQLKELKFRFVDNIKIGLFNYTN